MHFLSDSKECALCTIGTKRKEKSNNKIAKKSPLYDPFGLSRTQLSDFFLSSETQVVSDTVILVNHLRICPNNFEKMDYYLFSNRSHYHMRRYGVKVGGGTSGRVTGQGAEPGGLRDSGQ